MTPPTPDISPDNSRRNFLTTMMASGFALAVQPVVANTIQTNSTGLLAGAVSIPLENGGSLPAYVARPTRPSGALSVVLVVQEIFGVHEHIQDICRRLAHAGYLAVAPELYFRQGDPRQYKSIPELLAKVVSKVPDEQVFADLDAAAKWAASNGGDAERIAITGFCWGGRITWLYAAHNPKLKAAVAWYGRLMGESTPNTPKHPIDVVNKLKVPVLGLYGGLDQGIPQESVAKMRVALQTISTPTEIVVYPKANHGFNADYRTSYNPEAAKDGWIRMLAWFTQHGVKPSRIPT
jgi:carboxymethylenebutenolidase